MLTLLAVGGGLLSLHFAGVSPALAQDGSVPDQPTGLAAEASHDSVELTWDDPEDNSITHYQVLRRDRDIHDTGEFVTIDSDTGSAATSYTDDTVEPEKRYVYRVVAVNASTARVNGPSSPGPTPRRLPRLRRNLTQHQHRLPPQNLLRSQLPPQLRSRHRHLLQNPHRSCDTGTDARNPHRSRTHLAARPPSAALSRWARR